VIFVDSSFLIGLTDELDDRHHQARALVLLHERASLATTNHVVGETWTFLRKRHGHPVAVRFLDSARTAARLRIVAIEQELEKEAWDWLRQHDERVYSSVDVTSFALMRRLGIGEALAFDGDFTAAGFVELRV
jgi:uncharacterized protein